MTFICHPTGMPIPTIPGIGSNMPGCVDFAGHFDGDWDGWANSVINRMNPMTRKRAYDRYVSITRGVGRANFIILSRAFEAGLPTFVYEDGVLKPVIGITELDPENYTDTARLEVEP